MFDVAVVYLMRTEEASPQVLLGEKLTGLGRGKLVGPGGKSEGSETPRETAVREVWEEVGITVDPAELEPLAVIEYPFIDRAELSQRSHAFLARTFRGEPRRSSELDPRWWDIAEIPFDRMWSDAALWLPRAFAGEFLEATFHIGRDNSVVTASTTWSHSAGTNPGFLG